MGFLSNMLVRLGLDNSDFNSGMDRSTRAVNKFGQDVESAGRRLTVGISIPLIGVGVAAIKTAGEMEQAAVGFTTLLKSSDAARAHLEELKRFALTTPFQFPELAQASRLMQAYGFAAENVVPTLRTIGNAVSALGGGSDLLERVIRSVGEIGTRGKVTGEQLRELSRAGIPALDAIAKKLGVSVAEAQKQITAGTVDAKTALDAILGYMDQRFAGGMEAQSKTLLGAWSNIKDKLTFTLSDIGNSLLPFAKDFISGTLDPMLGKIKELAQGFAELPKPIQNTILAAGGLAAGLPLLAVALGATITNSIAIYGALSKLFPLVGKLATGMARSLVSALGISTANMTAFQLAGVAAAGTLTVALIPAIWSLAQAYMGMADAQDQAAQAGKTAEEKMKSMEQSLAQRAVVSGRPDLSTRLEELRKSYSMGRMGEKGDPETVTKYLRALQPISLELGKIAVSQNVVVSGQLAMVDASKSLEAAGIKTTAQRQKELEVAREAYKMAVQAGESAGVQADALKKVKEAEAALSGESLKAEKALKAIPFAEKSMEGKILVGRIDLIRESIAKTAVEMEKWLNQNPGKGPADFWAKQFSDASASMDRFRQMIPPAIESLSDMGVAVDDNAKFMGLLTDRMMAAQKAAMDQSSWGMLESGMKALGQTSSIELSRMADEADKNFKKIKETGVATTHDLNDAWIEAAKRRIEADLAAGKISREEYERIRKSLEDFTKEVPKAAKTGVDFGRQVSTALNDMGRSLADVMFGTKKISEAWKDLGKSIVRIILEDVIGRGINELMKALSGLLSHLGKVGKVLSGLFGGGASTATSAAGGAASTGGSLAGGAGAAASGLAGWIGAIGSVGTMISSVIGNFQNAKMETTMNAVELNTRIAAISLGQGPDSISENMKNIRNQLTTFFSGVSFGTLIDLMKQITDVVVWNLRPDGSAAGVSGGGAPRYGVTFNNCTFNGTSSGSVAASFAAAGLAGALG